MFSSSLKSLSLKCQAFVSCGRTSRHISCQYKIPYKLIWYYIKYVHKFCFTGLCHIWLYDFLYSFYINVALEQWIFYTISMVDVAHQHD